MATLESFSRPENASSDGGIVFSAASVKEQRKIATDWLKQVGMNILDIRNVMRTSLPVRLFEGRSYLQRVADSFAFGTPLLKKAAESTDPVERLKFVMAFMLSGLHLTCKQAKPFNPILGETFQATYPDGTQVYCEQVSHHPMVSAWELVEPNGLFHLSGHGQWIGSFRGNSVKGHQLGDITVRFHDSDTVHYGPLPEMWMRGVLLGERRVEYLGLVPFYYPRYQLACTLQFNPDAGFVNFFTRKQKPSDWVRGDICRIAPDQVKKAQDHFASSHSQFEDEDDSGGKRDDEPPKEFSGHKFKGEQVSHVEGTWLGGIEFDNQRLWDRTVLGEHNVVDPTPVADPLPSDSRFRGDLMNLLKEDWDASAKAKHELEELQRHDARLREASRKKRSAKK
eukprot:TRINITY_DN1806_c0_g1_i2.p1 TRINITY_DN1806_c0_g1~~TRINITY_DN1806_c0_g1_i2.p1  ORF type:complete len:413 (-),score=77.45 TRINITY_DN1806_c0_g1_i2:891-2075(-)